MILDSYMVIKLGAMSTMNIFKWTQQLMKVIKIITLIWTDIVLKLLKYTIISNKEILKENPHKHIFVFSSKLCYIWNTWNI